MAKCNHCGCHINQWQCECGHSWITEEVPKGCPKCHVRWGYVQCFSCNERFDPEDVGRSQPPPTRGHDEQDRHEVVQYQKERDRKPETTREPELFPKSASIVLFPRRVLGFIIDLLIATIVSTLLALIHPDLIYSFFGYLLLRDTLSRNGSPGKMAVGLTIQSRGAENASPLYRLLRNLTILPPLFVVEAFVAAGRPDGRRLGDMLAKTAVASAQTLSPAYPQLQTISDTPSPPVRDVPRPPPRHRPIVPVEPRPEPRAKCSLMVRITAQNAGGLRSVHVTLRGPSSRFMNTGDESHAHFTDIMPGRYIVAARKSDYKPAETIVTLSESMDKKTVTLTLESIRPQLPEPSPAQVLGVSGRCTETDLLVAYQAFRSRYGSDVIARASLRDLNVRCQELWTRFSRFSLIEYGINGKVSEQAGDEEKRRYILCFETLINEAYEKLEKDAR